jgi:hypothetical protein
MPPELIGRVAATRTEGINLRGVFRFPIERFTEHVLPSSKGLKRPVRASEPPCHCWGRALSNASLEVQSTTRLLGGRPEDPRKQ